MNDASVLLQNNGERLQGLVLYEGNQISTVKTNFLKENLTLKILNTQLAQKKHG